MQVKDKTVLITGAARGIGQAIVMEFAKAGADVIGVDLSHCGSGGKTGPHI